MKRDGGVYRRFLFQETREWDLRKVLEMTVL